MVMCGSEYGIAAALIGGGLAVIVYAGIERYKLRKIKAPNTSQE